MTYTLEEREIYKTLKNCPSERCRAPVFKFSFSQDDDGHWQVRCICGMTGPKLFTAEDAARAWNDLRRWPAIPITPTQRNREIKRLRKIVRESNINFSDRMTIEATVAEYALLVPMLKPALTALAAAEDFSTSVLEKGERGLNEV